MKLTILGKYGPFPAAGGACSGYFVEQGGTRVLIDCGSGVLSRLQQVCDIRELDGIVLSHLHSDHMSDMMILRYALDIRKTGGRYEKGPLPVYLPENPRKVFEQIASEQAYRPIGIKSGEQVDIGALSFAFREMTHPVQSFAMAIENGDRKIVYTGDTSLNPDIKDFAAGADLFLADAGLLERDRVPGRAPHLSAEEVGRIAKDAGVKRLILTHIRPGYEERELVNEAAAHFPEPILAEEMKSYLV